MSNLSELCQSYKKLSTQEELELLKINDARSRQKLIMSIMPLIINQARKLVKVTKQDVNDLINDGVIGAYKAIDTFDATLGTKWSSYAVGGKSRVYAEMQESIKNSELIPRSVKDRVDNTYYNVASFDQQITEDGSTLSDLISDENATDPSSVCDNVLSFNKSSLAEVVQRLQNNKYKKTLTLFGQGLSCREIGKLCGVSHEMANKNKEKAISELRKILTSEGVFA
jgi:RNA polymerase sporulation-specific sigma factor